jgi:hypothetical protein
MSKTADDPSSSDSATTVVKPAVNRRSEGVLDYHPPTASDRFWRMFSSREKVIENLKTLAWVIPITLVVWIYAEREQVVTPPPVSSVPIQIAPDPIRYTEFAGNPDPTVSLKLTGPQQAFDRVRQQLSAIPSPLKIDLSNIQTGMNIPVTVLDRIQNNDVFKNNGVTVQAVEPATLHVNIEELGQKDLPVEVPTQIANLSDVTFDPSKVTVRGPNDELKAGVRVFANLSGLSLKPGKNSLTGVLLSLSPQGKLRIDPGQTKVKADFTVQDADVEAVIKSIPIEVQAAPSLIDSFKISVNNGVGDVYNTKVKGPKVLINDLINDLEQKDPKQQRFHARAVLELDADDRSPSKELVYMLPPGVTVDKEDQARKIDFKLAARGGD